jgi:NADH dehydrogenase FAD-containing subunit
MTKTVVILGGSFGGLHVAHALLKKQHKDLKVILVSKVRRCWIRMNHAIPLVVTTG